MRTLVSKNKKSVTMSRQPWRTVFLAKTSGVFDEAVRPAAGIVRV